MKTPVLHLLSIGLFLFGIASPLSSQVMITETLAYSVRRDSTDLNTNINVRNSSSNVDNRKGFTTWDLSSFSTDFLQNLTSVQLSFTPWNSFGSNPNQRIRIFAISLPATNSNGTSSLTTIRTWDELIADGVKTQNNTGFSSSANLSPVFIHQFDVPQADFSSTTGVPVVLDLTALTNFVTTTVAQSDTRWMAIGFASDVQGDNYLISRDGQGDGISLTLIPEPGTYAAVTGAIFLLVAFIIRRRLRQESR
jgi:hypothetical protein